MAVTSTTSYQQPGPIGGMLGNLAQTGIGSVVANPQTAYTGPMAAGWNPMLWGATNNAQNATGYQAPTVQAGSIPQTDISRYMSPYTGQVVQTSLDELTRQLARSQQATAGNAALAGAFGGDRSAIMQAENKRNADQIAAQTIAGLNNQGWQSATGLATQDLNRQMQAGQGNQFANLQGANLALNANQQLAGLGSAYRNAENEINQGNYATFLRNQSLPMANAVAPAQAWAPYASALSTGVNTAPDPSTLSQVAGLGLTGLAGLSLLGGKEGVSGGLGALGSGVNWLGKQIGNGVDWLTGSSTPDYSNWSLDQIAGDPTAMSDLGWFDVATGGRVGYADGGAVDDDLFVPAYADGGAVGLAGGGEARDLNIIGFAPDGTPIYSDETVTPTAKPFASQFFAPQADAAWSGLSAGPYKATEDAPALDWVNPEFPYGGLAGHDAPGTPYGGQDDNALPHEPENVKGVGLDAPSGSTADNPGGNADSAWQGLAAATRPAPEAPAEKPAEKPQPVASPLAAPAYTLAATNETPLERPGLSNPMLTRVQQSADPGASLGGQQINPGNSWAMPALAAGLGILAGRSPHASVNIGAGGLTGMQMWQQQQQAGPLNALNAAKAEAAQLGNQRMRMMLSMMDGNGGPGGGLAGYTPANPIEAGLVRNYMTAYYGGDMRQANNALAELAKINPELVSRIAAAKGGADAAARYPYEIGRTITGASANAEAQANYRIVEVPMKMPNGEWVMKPMPASQAVAMMGGNLPSGQSGGMSMGDYAGAVVKAESDGDANARNPRSTATGAAQFIDSTWIPLVKQSFPQQTAGMSDQQILALRNDPKLSALMTVQYARQNAPVLQQAGLPVNAATLAIAHRFGPEGAVKLLNSPANAPVPSIFGRDVLAANPDLANKTAFDVVNGMTQKFGRAPVQGIGDQQPGIPGKPFETKQQTRERDLAADQTKDDIKRMGDHRDKLTEAAGNAHSLNALLDEMDAQAQTWQMGKFADAKGQFKAYLDSIGQSLGAKPMESVGDWQAFNKNSMELARQATRATSARAAWQEMQMIRDALPNATMSPQAFANIKAQLQGCNDYVIAKAAASADFKGNPAQFDREWYNTTPMAFVVRRMSTDQVQQLATNLSKTEKGQELWGRIIRDARRLDQQGLFGGNQQMASAQ